MQAGAGSGRWEQGREVLALDWRRFRGLGTGIIFWGQIKNPLPL
jgi:hypothetical protein